MDNHYEINELQDYDEKKGFVPNTNAIQVHQKQSSGYNFGKVGISLLVIVAMMIFFALGIILGITTATLNQVNNLPLSCDAPTTGSPGNDAATGGDNQAGSTTTTITQCNCTADFDVVLREVTQSDKDLKEKVDQLNSVIRNEVQTQMSAILNKTTTCAANDIEQMNITDSILKTTGESAQKLMNIINTLSNHKDTSTSTAGVVDEILLVVQELLVLHNDTADLPTSCQQIKAQNPNSPSGVYLTVPAHGGSAVYTYCNMDTLCGSGGGWTRLAYLDMSDATQSCPSGFRLYQSGGVRACGRPSGGAGCTASIQFPSNGISYSEICGRVTGYQYYTPDAVSIHNGPSHNNLNADYVDGISITRGSPRQHVWTFMAGFSDTYYYPDNCPCANPPGSYQQIQSFVGSNYFCESGSSTSGLSPVLYASDPLWDGQGCGSNEAACCAASGLPWFHRDYGSATTSDYIELRVCGDENTGNEDVPVGFYEIYVK